MILPYIMMSAIGNPVLMGALWNVGGMSGVQVMSAINIYLFSEDVS